VESSDVIARGALPFLLAESAAENVKGAQLYPQVATRPIGFVTSLQTYHMFQRRETHLKLKESMSHAELVVEMRKPEVKAAILKAADVPVTDPGAMAQVHGMLGMAAPFMYPLQHPVDYEPEPTKMLAARAQAAGQEIHDLVYDFLLQEGGTAFAILIGSNYQTFNHDAIEQMWKDPHTVIGLSDAGAHVNLIFDAVAPTYRLTHWARDRSRGGRLPIDLVVEKHSSRNAALYGFHDRGSLTVGKRADINLIDFDNLALGEMEVRPDLPAGGQRILQGKTGYLGTWVDGVRTRENDEDAGARPGRLARPTA